jgi:hypothetical protein
MLPNVIRLGGVLISGSQRRCGTCVCLPGFCAFVDETSRLALLMEEYGCLLEFEGLEAGLVQGEFTDSQVVSESPPSSDN